MVRLDDRVAPVIALALIGSLAVVVDLGCNRALDAADHHDDDVRARETAEISWWVREARSTLDLALLWSRGGLGQDVFSHGRGEAIPYLRVSTVEISQQLEHKC